SAARRTAHVLQAFGECDRGDGERGETTGRRQRLRPLIPASMSVTTGDTCTLQCTVSGSPELHTKWFKNGKELTQGRKYKITFSNGTATLEVSACSKADAGDYLCKASNASGANFCKARVTVRGTSWITTGLQGLRGSGEVPAGSQPVYRFWPGLCACFHLSQKLTCQSPVTEAHLSVTCQSPVSRLSVTCQSPVRSQLNPGLKCLARPF
uniref:Ig-like domain-containing protein n=1 Tax=Periophthalmus magnuspinnatus TaxID=409849 RepID=A0A3B4ABW8_9GOBI